MLYVNIAADIAAIVRNEFFQLFKIIIIGADKTVIVNTGISSGGDKVYFNALFISSGLQNIIGASPKSLLYGTAKIFSVV